MKIISIVDGNEFSFAFECNAHSSTDSSYRDGNTFIYPSENVHKFLNMMKGKGRIELENNEDEIVVKIVEGETRQDKTRRAKSSQDETRQYMYRKRKWKNFK